MEVIPSNFAKPAMLSTLFIVCFIFSHNYVLSELLPSFTKLHLPSTIGPESLAFDLTGTGPYTGVADGRILKYHGPDIGFLDFATTSPHRTKELCDGTTTLPAMCGRPLGMGFNKLDGKLYIVDAYFGLLAVGPAGGLATQLAIVAEGVPIAFADALDIDPTTGIVYFTDAGAVFRLGNPMRIILSGDVSGRLLKYDPKTKKVTNLLNGLAGPTGLAVSKDGEFVVVSEMILTSRIRMYWLRGPKANTNEILTNLPGNPDNVKRTSTGEFWVAANVQNLQFTIMWPMGIRFDASGNLLEMLTLSTEYNSTWVTEVHEYGDVFYIGSLFMPFVGVYTR